MNKRHGTKPWILSVLILLVAAIASVGIYFYRINQYQDYLPTPGVIVDIEQYSGSRHSSSGYRIFFEFEVNGTSYIGNTLYSGNHTDSQIGDTRDVWYDPDDPTQSSFHKPSPGLDPYGPFFIAIPLAISSYLVRKRMRSM